MNLNAKYPYFTAWVGLVALNVAAMLVLGFIVPVAWLQLVLQILISFFVFRFVVERNILPYVHKPDGLDRPFDPSEFGIPRQIDGQK